MAMLENFEFALGKVNLAYLNFICVTLDEIEALFQPETDWYPTEDGLFELIGYSTGRKFVCVRFDVSGSQIVIEDVYLPSYEKISKHICP